MRPITLALVAMLLLAGCSSVPAGPTPASATRAAAATKTADPSRQGSQDVLFPDVIAATASRSDDGTWQFSATISSPYDSPDRYADAWRVLAPGGAVLGVRELTHDHAGEQPFTRSLLGVDVPADIEVVTVEGRDQVNGWGGATVDVVLQP